MFSEPMMTATKEDNISIPRVEGIGFIRQILKRILGKRAVQSGLSRSSNPTISHLYECRGPMLQPIDSEPNINDAKRTNLCCSTS